MMKRIGAGLAALVAAALLVTAIEGQWFGYASFLLHGQDRPAWSGTESEPQRILDAAYDGENERITLLAVGDIADCPERPNLAHVLPATASLLGLTSPFDTSHVPASRTAELADRWPDAPILALGDLVYNSGTTREFSDCFDKVWGQERPRILPTPGNHEYETPGAFGYYESWAGRAGQGSGGYYAAHVGNWLVLSLNSEIEAGAGSPQAQWLSGTLAERPEACVLAFYHRPAYSLQHRGGLDSATALFRTLQAAGATLVLNGHNHFYERSLPLAGDGAPDRSDGLLEFVVGTGGETSKVRPVAQTTASAVFGHLGLLRLELGADSYRWWFHDSATGEVLDTGEGGCSQRMGAPA